ncbi:MAG: hydroxymethylbilane synthase [Frankiales bacterium]|jgi:hydroxymethylbilane synthase|nr:hydroxymethylbilane synthase [Frankiales bacterium]
MSALREDSPPDVSSAGATMRLGTRRSALALAQAHGVATALTENGSTVELVEVTTEGDRSRAAIQEFGGTGVFVTALRERLLAGDIDVAVHSLKDLPTAPADGVTLAAVPVREDPRDVVVSRDRQTLSDLGSGARIGTGAPRRAAQLRALGLGLDVVPVRGNVDTRLRMVADGELDAVVVARAGLARLGRLDEATETLDVDRMVPAPGQGALAIECRANEHALIATLGALDDSTTRAAVTAERAVLAALRAGCTAPVGAYAEPVTGPGGRSDLSLKAVVAADRGDGVRLSITGPLAAAEELGHALAAELLAAGAADLLGENQ